MAPPLILTLALSPADQERFDALRRQHFPPDRNFLSAHVTLFHRLPGEEQEAVLVDVRDVASRKPYDVEVSGVRLLGHGVALTLDSRELHTMREDLAQRWSRWLSPQDRQGFRPHLTIQNKVDSHRARALHAELSATFASYPVRAVGLHLWRYDGGPWMHLRSTSFAS